MIRVTAFKAPELAISEWHIAEGDAWCVVGPNGAGKQYVDQLLLGELRVDLPGSVTRDLAREEISLVSFEQQQEIFEREMKLAATDLLPESETATLTADFLPADRLGAPLIDALNLRHRLDSPYSSSVPARAGNY